MTYNSDTWSIVHAIIHYNIGTYTRAMSCSLVVVYVYVNIDIGLESTKTLQKLSWDNSKFLK